jgi:nicotinate-nucleotide adenylyltransferase
MQHSISKIGIMGGTFNPIHCGHLIIAEAVRESFCLDKVLFIPLGQPPHKPDTEVIDGEHRYEMVRRAIASNHYFEASRVEIDREGFTFTVNTLQILRDEYGPDARLFFIVGADVIPELTTWKDFKNVFQLCEFITVLRPGYNKMIFEADIEQLKKDYEIKLVSIKAPLIDISSRDIRERCSKGKSIKYLVTENVEEYITAAGLYRSTKC